MEEHYWRGQPCAGSSGSSICLPALQRRQSPAAVGREHMFDKVVTPSDVGKLNRLVIPKQYAERYFPLDSSGAGEKGFMLSFEDRTGKSWGFRYSYWSSSQSYVMTKGWSRFVKEKRLGAGDTVSFGRGAGEADRGRLFIDWTHRQDASGAFRLTGLTPPNHNYYCNQYCFGSSSATPFAAHPAAGPFLFWPPASVPPPPVSELDQCRQVGYGPRAATAGSRPTFLYFRSAPAPMGMDGRNEQGATVAHNAVSVVSGRTAAKQVRLFGVNLGCPETEAADPAEGDE